MTYNQPRQRSLLVLLVLLGAWLLAGCAGAGDVAPTSVPPTSTPTATPVPTPVAAEGTPASALTDVLTDPIGVLPGTIDEIAAAIAQRTPVPTKAPDVIEELVDEIAAETGLERATFLGLSGGDWLNVLASVLILVAGTLLANFLLIAVLRWLVARTPFHLDNEFFDAVELPLRWLVLVLVARFAALRLNILGSQWASLLDDFFFFAMLGVLVFGAMRLVTFVATSYRDHRVPPEMRHRVSPMVTIFTRLGYLLVLVVAGALALGRLGVNVTLLSAFLLILGLIIGLGARDAISDAVSGAFFLLDQRFRIGDDIYMQELDTRGIVVEVGIRQTRLQTADNNIAIIPNSLIAGSQILNYSVPDPSYRLHTDVGVSYASDADYVNKLLEATVRSLPGVLPDRRVDVYFMSFGDSARLMRVNWWVSGQDDRFESVSQANRAIERALTEAGVEMPFNTLDVNLRSGPPDERQPGSPDVG